MEVETIKTRKIDKSLKTAEITDEQLKAISKFTRRKMNPEELFVFSLVLCDNEIDRDHERFPKESLTSLSELYLGKTGVFDHVASTENQSARIFSTEVVANGEKTSTGQDYFALKAYAYMVRCEKTNDLILEIDAGIKKEVSVGCAVQQVVCSVCGADIKVKTCEHEKGKAYGVVSCHHLLLNPTDAYEWSFVAVPAQKKAGVVKRYQTDNISKLPMMEKIQKANSAINLSYSEVLSLRNHIATLQELSKSGEEYVSEIKKDIIRNASVAHPEMDCAVLEDVCALMNISQLKAFQHSYKALRELDSPVVQIKDPVEPDEKTQRHFKI